MDPTQSATVPRPAGEGLADRLRSAAARGDDGAIEKAARSFETFFVQEMLSDMRATTKPLGDGLFDSSAMDTWTEQLDSAVAEEVAGGAGIGLARMIVASLHREGVVAPPGPAKVDGVRRAGWSWPLGADGGRVSSDFGEREHPTLGEVRMHHGLDLAAPEGTAIHAAADGVVTRAELAGGYGLLVEVEHGDGIVTRYAHQSATNVAVGDRVRAGDKIGEVGSSGRSTGPHLHLEVRVDGEPVDPVDFLGGHHDR